MKKVLLVLPSLKPGGAERVLSFLAKNLDNKRYNTTLLVLGYEKDTAYDIVGLDVVFLEKDRLLLSLIGIIKEIRRIKPHVVLSSITHVNLFMSILTFFFKRTKFIAREASVISTIVVRSQLKIYSRTISWLYNRLFKVICQSQEMLDDLIVNYNISKEKLIIINNPITKIPPLKPVKKKSEYIQFITVGRLSEEKGHKRILDALRKINYPFYYTIIGDGPLKKDLITQVKKHKLIDKVKFVTYTNEVSTYLSNADVFLQGSYVEGFPNAVLESCVVGTPVLAFKAPGGTKEIIKNGVTGYITESENEFLEILKNITVIKNLTPENIRAYVCKRFNSELILSKYIDLFDKIPS